MIQAPPLWLATALTLALALQGCCESDNPRDPDPQDMGDLADTGDARDLPDGQDMADMDPDLPEEATLSCDQGLLLGEVQASDWARRVAGIDHYRYGGGLQQNELLLEARDAQGQPLASLTIYQIPEEGQDGLPDGAMVADFSAPALGEGSLWSSGRTTGDGYAIASRMQTPQGELRLEARFVLTRCAPTPPEGAPACAWPLELGQAGVTLHACGLPAWDSGQARSPQLAELIYVAQGQRPQQGERRLLGEEPASVLTVFNGQEVASQAQIDAWAAQTGADAVLGTPLERLIATAHLDPAWHQRVRLHADRCQAAQDGLLAGQQQGLSVRRQALGPQGPGKRDSGRNLASAIKDLDKRISDAAPVKEVTICIPGTGCGKSSGDPHLITFDGLAYDFQGTGEFVLARSRDQGDPWQVQARFEPPEGATDERCRSVTVTTRLAFPFQGEVWEATLEPAQLLRQGQPVDLSQPLAQGHEVVLRDGALFLTWPSGASLELRGTTAQINLPPTMQSRVEGLLGRYDGSDLLYDAQGLAHQPPLAWEQLYLDYGESWRVTQQNSLFTYDEGQGPEDFHDRSRPSAQITAADFSAQELEQPRQVCAQAGLEDPWLLDACLLDSFCASAQVGTEAARGGSPRASMSPGAPLIAGPGRFVYALEALPQVAPRSQGACAEDGEPLALVYAEHDEFVTLEGPLSVDLAAPGSVEESWPANQALDTDAEILSYAIYLPPVQEAAPRALRLTFPSPILGVIAQGELLSRSEAALGLEDPGWGPAQERGLEPERDAIALAPDRKTLTVRMDGRINADMVRVLVEVDR